MSLVERIEGASGPDRELDGEIDRLFNKRPADGDYDEEERAFWRLSDGWSGLLVRASDGYARGAFCAPNYTKSIDEALTLADPHALWAVGRMEDGPFARICWPQPDGSFTGGYFEATAATAELALVLVILRAREASNG